MPTSYTSLLGLALPATGELSGTWGDEVNNYITQYLDASVAGTQTISGSQTAVTLSKTTNASLSQAGSGATGSSQYQIINCTGNPATALTITVPSASKVYLVLNNTSTNQAVTVKPSAAAGVTVSAGRAALIAWNGTDFELVGTDDAARLSGILAVVNGGTGASSASGARTNLGATTLGGNLFTIPNPSAVTFPRFNADNTVSALNAADFRTAIGAGSGAGDVVAANNNAFTGANTFFNATGQTFAPATANDGIVLQGRAGGTSSYRVTFTTATLSASRTVTLPDANTAIPVATQVLTFSGPSAARTVTLPDANFTVARTDAAQTFTGTQTVLAAATQDAIALAGRAGGTSSYVVTLTPATLSANRTVTIPNETFTVGFRNLPPVGTQTGSYTLGVNDVGKYVQIGSGGSITIPTSTFSDGDAITLYNNTTGAITITCSAPTAYIAGTNTVKTSMSLTSRGVATILFTSSTTCVVSGNVS